MAADAERVRAGREPRAAEQCWRAQRRSRTAYRRSSGACLSVPQHFGSKVLQVHEHGRVRISSEAGHEARRGSMRKEGGIMSGVLSFELLD